MIMITKKDIWMCKETNEEFNPIDFQRNANEPDIIILKSINTGKTVTVSTGSLTAKYKRIKLGSRTNRNDIFSF